MGRPRVTEAGSVLDAAARRLATHGVADTTVDDVAAEAGVSRATVYRYAGGKDDIVQAVIGRETEAVVDKLRAVIATSVEIDEAVADVVAAALTAIGESPVLDRLSSTDLRETLLFITVDAAPLVRAVVTTVADAMRTAPFAVDERRLEDAVEELTRFVLAHITTPRRDGSRLDPTEAGVRAAALVAPLLAPGPQARSHSEAAAPARTMRA